MKIPINVVVHVDPRAWAERFGVAPMKVEADVQSYFEGLVHRELRELGLVRYEPNEFRPGMREFRDDDAGYLSWLAAHPDGYVINIRRSYNAIDARVHHADCRTISGQNPAGVALTGPYVKVCAEHLADLELWAIHQLGKPIPRCGTCHPAQRRRTTHFNQADRTGGRGPGARGSLRDPRTGGGQCRSRGLGR